MSNNTARKHPDLLLLGSIFSLIIFGVIIMASVSGPASQDKTGNPYYFFNHQLIFGLLPGLFLGMLAFKVKLPTLKKLAPILLLVNLVLVAAVFLPKLGAEAWGASRWLKIGPISFQPSEFLKLTFILYLASLLEARTQRLANQSSKTTLLVFAAIAVIIGFFLAIQPDISTLGIILLTSLLMYFLSQTPFWHSLVVAMAGAASLIFLIKVAPYRFYRIATFLNPDLDPMGKSFQINRAIIAIGSGGIFGQGLGMSLQKFGSLPQTISDSIFAIFAEEAGFVGSMFLISLFLLFLWGSFRIVRKAPDRFSQLTALGISSWIVIQAFINIGSMTGVLPMSGVPLPFISYGGSALIAELAGMGILLNISRNAK